MLRVVGAVVAWVFFALGTCLALWAAIDPPQTGLFGVETRLQPEARAGIAVLGLLFCAPVLGWVLLKVPPRQRSASPNDVQPAAELTERERHLIEEARRKPRLGD